jgi:hypothetical protein
MLQVICIDDSFENESKRPTFQFVERLPVFGIIYKVKKQVMIDGYLGYELYLPNPLINGKPVVFKAERFIPLTPDEELIETETYNQCQI